MYTVWVSLEMFSLKTILEPYLPDPIWVYIFIYLNGVPYDNKTTPPIDLMNINHMYID